MDVKAISHRIHLASSIVFFGGAGTSTESNIPDFRTNRGLYSQPTLSRKTPEELLSISTLNHEPETFYTYYRNHLVHPEAKPNKAHQVLAQWEKKGKLNTVITQNIDGLHQMSGSRNVLELHGSVHRNHCIRCNTPAELCEIMNLDEPVPRCRVCDGMLRPDVVLYGEGLNLSIINQAVHALQRADLLIVGGTSLVVYPAAGLIEYYQGKDILIINREPTPFDQRARWILRDPIGDVLWQINDELLRLENQE